MSVDLGDVYTITVETRNTAGALATTSGVSLAVTLPDGTAAAGSPFTMTESPTGIWTYPYATTVVGHHSTRATASGTITGVFADDFTVTGAWEGIISLAEARDMLGLDSTADDEILRSDILAATDCCQDRTGRIWVRTAFNDTFDGGCDVVQLRKVPVLSVTSAAENGVTVAASGYVLNGRRGRLYRGTATGPSTWMSGRQIITVSYIAGPTGGVIPEAVRRGVKECVKHFWESRRAGSGIPRQGAETEWVPILGYSIPRRVAELWETKRRGPRVA